MEKYFNYRELEKKWYDFWLNSGYFKPDLNSSRPPFCIVIPPPNVTGILHMGHALDQTLQDTLIRYKRMKGFDTLWVVGTDHAGIATQNVVEKELRKEKKRKEDLGREAFVELVWKWKEKHHRVITEQIKRLGSSCDWSRERFTMDEGLSRAVVEVFVRLYKDGLIYRGERITNWCPRCKTALSDLEVIPKETKGRLYHIFYPLEDDPSQGVIVATTRPETMLGDTAVAVNPEDARYKYLHNKRVILPLLNKPIPIIADSYVDLEFGTGALKVTPGHDFNDFEIGARHKLETVNILNRDGSLNSNTGIYQGTPGSAARDRILADLQAAGYLKKQEDYVHSVGHCQRCDAVVEPMVSMQWFARVKPLAEQAQAAVNRGETVIVPKNWKKTWDEWLNNIRDWCISRQLWWGHRIPAYTCTKCGEVMVETTRPTHCTRCGNSAIEQDEDVLDTWFSSALWPFSTLGWPDDTPELRTFYPTSVMITGFDIIFFWVARMMMMGLRFMKQVPFKEVYFHALVLDAHGKKMSKSSGNALDPILMTDKFGTDALRYCMVALSAQGRNIRLSEDKIEGYRNFVNKIWNASKLVISQINPADKMPDDLVHYVREHSNLLSFSDRWIVGRLQETIQAVSKGIEQFEFDSAASSIYQFFWRDFCDWYLEAAKFAYYGKLGEKARKSAVVVSASVLEQTLRLLHPIMPFVTEEIWQHFAISLHKTKSIMIAPYPEHSPELVEAFSVDYRKMNYLMAVTTEIRNIRGEHVIAPSAELQVTAIGPNPEIRSIFEEGGYLIEGLAKAELHIQDRSPGRRFVAKIVIEGHDILVDLEGIVDREKENERLSKELSKLDEEVARLGQKLSNADFVAKAPADLIEKEKQKLADYQLKKKKLAEARDRLG